MGTPARALERAERTAAAIRTAGCYSRRHHCYGRRRLLVFRSYEHLWPFAGAWSALATLSSLRGGTGTAGPLADFPLGLDCYEAAGARDAGEEGPLGFDSTVVPPLGTGGDRYYDDNAWLALAMLRTYELTGDGALLSLARRVQAFALSGWSGDPRWAHPGGIRWKEPLSNVSRNTCSNAPVAELCVLVHLATGDARSLDWARQIYAWVRDALAAGDLYADHLFPDGTVDPTVWTYNQGTMVGAGVLLARATGEDGYLEQARATATATLSRFPLEQLLLQDPAFNAVLFRNLLLLGADEATTGAAAAYGDAMWTRWHDPRTGLFSRRAAFLNNTAAMVQVYALLAGAPPHA